MRLMRVTTLVLLAAAMAACGRAAKGGETAADSTAVGAPLALTDTAAAAPADSASPQASTPPDASPTKSPAKTPAAKTPDVIGHDSAFGPKYTVDSTGKITPIAPPAKKKP